MVIFAIILLIALFAIMALVPARRVVHRIAGGLLVVDALLIAFVFLVARGYEDSFGALVVGVCFAVIVGIAYWLALWARDAWREPQKEDESDRG